MLGMRERKEEMGEHLMISGIWMCMLERGGVAAVVLLFIMKKKPGGGGGRVKKEHIGLGKERKVEWCAINGNANFGSC